MSDAGVRLVTAQELRRQVVLALALAGVEQADEVTVRAARASRSRRLMSPSSLANSGRSSLSATRSPVCACAARKTWPMPPSPGRASMRYGPTASPTPATRRG